MLQISMNKKEGFTLLEVLIYTAVLAMLLIIVSKSLIVVISTYRAFDARRDIQDSAISSIERITREIRNAGSVSTSGSAFGSNPGSLVISVNEEGTPVTREFSISNGRLHLYEDGNDLGPLTSADVEVQNLIFYHLTTENSELVKIELGLVAGEGKNQVNKSFFFSTVLRGSYAN